MAHTQNPEDPHGTAQDGSMGSSAKLTVRNLRFQFDERIPRHWHSGSAARSGFFDAFSIFLPAGERFFVNSVKHQLPKLTDPTLAEQARLFCGQEGIHQREHENYNRMLDARGYPAARLERWVVRVLMFVTWVTLPRWRLGVTCALEHFTAIGAIRALSDPHLLAEADPLMRAFWRWHAAEETEHKTVPFDIYRAVGGGYLERVLIMVSTTIIFRCYHLLHQLCFMWVDRCLFSAEAWRELVSLLADRGQARRFLRNYFAYYRRDFHPSQLDDARLLQEFQRELTTSEYYRNAAAAS